jgi:hypothetical protein
MGFGAAEAERDFFRVRLLSPGFRLSMFHQGFIKDSSGNRVHQFVNTKGESNYSVSIPKY